MNKLEQLKKEARDEIYGSYTSIAINDLDCADGYRMASKEEALKFLDSLIQKAYLAGREDAVEKIERGAPMLQATSHEGKLYVELTHYLPEVRGSVCVIPQELLESAKQL